MGDSMTGRRPLYLILGPSGSGKTTIVRRVCGMMRVTEVCSHTTRPRREGEPEDAYFFVNDACFDRLMANKALTAHTTYDGHRYGATWISLRLGDLYIIDPAGAAMLEQAAERGELDRPLIEVFICADPNVLYDRMIARGDSPEDAERRVQTDRKIFDVWQMQTRGRPYLQRTVNTDPMYVDGVESNIITERCSAAALAKFIASNWPD